MNINLYLIFLPYFASFPPRKWVPLGQMMVVGSKNTAFFTGVRQWPVLCFLLIKAAVL